MAAALQMQVVTPQRILLSEEIEALVVPATEGFLGILPHHAPIITGLVPGPIKYTQAGKSRFLAITGGFMEVSQNQVTILADAAEKPGEIDVARAEAARDRAEQRIGEKLPDIDLGRAELAFKRATARLKVSQYGNHDKHDPQDIHENY